MSGEALKTELLRPFLFLQRMQSVSLHTGSHLVTPSLYSSLGLPTAFVAPIYGHPGLVYDMRQYLRFSPVLDPTSNVFVNPPKGIGLVDLLV